jgi:diguanylate cyclase (GGDEF)-like protein/PAS domain S-box-containing protein
MKLHELRLSTRITAAALLVVALAALAILFIEEARLREAYVAERRTDLKEISHAEKIRLAQTIETLRRDVLFLSNAPPISGILRAARNNGYDARDGDTLARWEARLQQIFTAFSNAHPGYYQIRYIGVADGGRELVRVDRRGDKVEVTPPAGLQAKGDRDYFRATLNLRPGQVHLSAFDLNQERGAAEQPYRLTVRAATPVFDENGRIFGMAVINMEVADLLKHATLGLPAGVRAYIANRDGSYLLHPDVRQSAASVLERKNEILLDFPSLKPMFDLRAPDYLPLHAVAVRNVRDYVAAERIHFSSADPDRFLLLVYQIPAAVATQQVSSIPPGQVAGGFAAMLLVAGILLQVLRRTFAPLEQLAGAADRIASGEHMIHLPKSDGGEIGRLLNAFGAMQERLVQREREISRINAGLERQVAERTAELERINEQLRGEIVQRERAVETVRREHDFRQEMIESLPGIFYMIDASGRFLMWNDNLERVLKCGADEISRSHPLDFFEGNDRILIESSIHKVFEQGEATVDALLTARDGTRTPYHFTGRRIVRDGEPVLVGLGIDIAERQRILRETEMLLRRNQALMLTSMDGIHIMDMEGNIVAANDAFCRMLGYSQEEVSRLNVADWDAQWSGEELRARFRELVGRSELFETVHRRKDGTLINVEISSAGVELDGEKYLYASSRDVTERKRYEAAILAAQNQLKAVFDAIPDLLFELGLDGRYYDYHSPHTELLAAPPEVFLGKTVAEILPPGASEVVMAALQEAHETGWSSGRQFELPLPQGKLWFELSVSRKATAAGEEPRFIVLSRDITGRKHAEQVLLQHKIVIDTAQDGFWVVDEWGYLREVNEAYARMTGYSVEELVGMHISQLEAKEQPEEVRAHIGWIVAQGHDRFETRHRRKDGREIDIEVSVTYMPESRRFFVFCHDITRRKQAEQDLRVAATAFETHDAIMITGADANIIRVNQAFTDITGYRADEVLGKNPRIMSSGRQDRNFYIEMWQQLLHTGSWAGEVWDRRKSGQIYPKWLTITAVKDEHGEITHYVGIFSDITARKHAEEEIRNLAFYDALTKLPNRRLFLDRFRAALPASARHRNYGAVLFIDMDKFKQLNDTLGHDYGDLMLIEVAHRIKSCVREMDTVARLGGDEFVVLIEEVSKNMEEASHKVGLVAEKIRGTLSQPYQLKDHEHHSSPSIGISLYRGNENPVEELLRHADMAMYQAKDAGRNAVRFFDPVMQENVAAHAALEHDLRNALAMNQLQLYYQMQVDGSQQPIGAEALLRWVHPLRGVVGPADFIPVAEESTLILDIGQWVLDEACRQLALWDGHEKVRDLSLAVNVSAKQFALPDFVERVDEALRKYGVAPSRLKLELTESMVLGDLAGTVAKMLKLRELGVRLSMDDFGTGYSSLSYLKCLPLDQLKIDQSFVRGIVTDSNDALLVQTIIDLAQNFRLNVIAEGVENEAQLAFLKQHRCMAYQGYLFSRPVPVEEFEAMLERT